MKWFVLIADNIIAIPILMDYFVVLTVRTIFLFLSAQFSKTPR